MKTKLRNKKIKWAKRCGCACHADKEPLAHDSLCCPVPNLKLEKEKKKP